MTVTVAFSGGPLAGELRTLPGLHAPQMIEIPLPPRDLLFGLDEVDPAAPVEIRKFTYVRHSHDHHTDVTVYIPEAECRPPLAVSPTWPEDSQPKFKHWMCGDCEVRWYGQNLCWMCGRVGT